MSSRAPGRCGRSAGAWAPGVATAVTAPPGSGPAGAPTASSAARKKSEREARGVAIVGVAWKDDPAATRRFLDELGDPYSMVLVDRDGRAGLDLGITGAPETFAVDAMGRVTAKASAPLMDQAEIDRLVASMQAPPRPLPTATHR